MYNSYPFSKHSFFLVDRNLAKGSLLHYWRKFCVSHSTAIYKKGCPFFSPLLGLLLILTCYSIWSGKHSEPPLLPKNHTACQVATEIQHMEIRFSASKKCDGKAAACPRWFLQLWHFIPSSSWTAEALRPDRFEVCFQPRLQQQGWEGSFELELVKRLFI